MERPFGDILRSIRRKKTKIMYGGTTIAELMQYFRKTEGIHPKFEKLSRRVQYYKEQKEGVGSMSDVVEEYAKKYAKEYAKREIKETQKESAIRLFREGASLEMAGRVMPELSKKELEELQKQALEPQQ